MRYRRPVPKSLFHRLGVLASGAALACLFSVGDAHANGRFPASNHIFFAESDPNLVLLRVTFGLIVSRDRGATWGWVCEASIGSGGAEDPVYTVTPSGRMVATT